MDRRDISAEQRAKLESIVAEMRDFPTIGWEPECDLIGRMDALDRDNAACYHLMADALQQYLDGQIDAETYEQYRRDLWDLSIGITEATITAFDEFMTNGRTGG